MSNIAEAKKIHIVGIAGVGLSALAQLLHHEGKIVSGSDNAEFPTLSALDALGIPYTIGYRASNIPSDVDLIIHTDAAHEDNVERAFAKEQDISDISYFEALGEVSKNKYTIAIAGTHGKTTTTGMVGKLLIDAGKNPTVIVGSLMKDFGGNFVPGDPNLLVVEACEYRDHVLKLHPNILVITNLEWDHTDWFPNLEAVQKMFREAILRLPRDGIVVTNPADQNIAPILEAIPNQIIDYTKEEVSPLSLIGDFNVQNAKAAKATARAYANDVDSSMCDTSLTSFKGSWRRFEYKGVTKEGAVVYDDYAHHPTAVLKTIEGVREKFPDKEVTVVFHPHLYSRTRDLMDSFATALALADRILIAPIYPAREQPIPGVTSGALAEKIQEMNGDAEAISSFEAIIETLHHTCGEHDIIVTMGAGDIYKVADEITR